MSFNHITLKNFRQNIRHYGMFLFSLLISIILYFSFSTLKYARSINNSESGGLIKNGATIGSITLFFIIIIFLMYANHLFVKRRTREFALFQLIGLTRSNILRMICIEQLSIFVITSVFGVIIGVFGSQLLLHVAASLMKLKVHLSVSFEPQALLVTLLMLLMAFILIMFQNWLFLKRRSILSMMKDSSKTEATQSRITVKETIGGILGIIMIALGYYIATEMFGVFKPLTLSMLSPFIILFLTIVGAYLFFRSSVSFIFKTIRRAKNGRVSITDVVSTSSIMHRMKKNAMSLTVIAVISAITVSTLCFAVITYSSTDSYIQSSSPQDFNIEKTSTANKFEHQLNQHHIPFSKVTYESITPKTVQDKVMSFNGKENHSEVTPIMRNPKLKGKQAKLTNTKLANGMIHFNMNNHITVKGKSKQTVKVTEKDDDKVYPTSLSSAGPIIQVSPKVYHSLKEKKITQHNYGYNLKHHSDVKKAEHIAHKVDPFITSRDSLIKMMDMSNGILMFVSSFLGLAFLIAAGCIIYIKQVDETEDGIDNFKVLRRIGFTTTDMAKGLFLNILFNFGLPLVIALLHAFFAAYAFMKIMDPGTYKPVIIIMIIYAIVYFIFAFFAYLHSMRVIKHSI
ncbi:ABC transporter permease [Staphylococcus sp. SQ8-PEA]|uniref:ABC transporter permease n=1 Tax=Staphylococcus marylandisciuri TaxID=2981529 RepID=A0ABT2QSM4_9STAP|nr:ABC transporter permease [Staphylococcus marylandisciuri]MCU5746948.1 ABC transporter permease [Staphylococcus marylandisciuri]